MDPNTLQHFNIKIHARQPVSIDLAEAIPVFHRWIRENVRDELLVDVADYRHVSDGPGVILVGHQANYSLDLAGGRLGLLYNRKDTLDGTAREKLEQAFQSALAACRILEQEPPFQGKLHFDAGDCELLVNDRLLAPNTSETFLAMKAELESYFAARFRGTEFSLALLGEPRERFRVGIKAAEEFAVADLLVQV
jgi:hypothetical protein